MRRGEVLHEKGRSKEARLDRGRLEPRLDASVWNERVSIRAEYREEDDPLHTRPDGRREGGDDVTPNSRNGRRADEEDRVHVGERPTVGRRIGEVEPDAFAVLGNGTCRTVRAATRDSNADVLPFGQPLDHV